MSKKKAFSGSTMTLKDFHGGSIPSDLPLPSAPGLIARPSDRPGFERQIPNAWGNPANRSDHRSRPGSSGTTRNFDEKASLLSHPLHIGRNFDEDERKPLDGVSTPRRTVSDETLRVPSSRPEQKPERFTGQVSSSVSHSPTAIPSSYPARFTGTASIGMNQKIQAGSPSSHPNAWGTTRKEVVGFSADPVPSSAFSGPGAVSRFAQASALEKISSGRWQSKHPIHHSPDVEVIRYSDPDTDFRSKDNNSYMGIIATMSERGGDHERERERERSPLYPDATDIVRSPVYPEAKGGSLSIYPDGLRPASTEGKFVGSQIQSPMHSEVSERPKLKLSSDYGVRPASTEGKFDGSQIQSPMPSEVSERPKLKLLPRSKPLENSEPLVVENKLQGYQYVDMEIVNESHVNANPLKVGLAGAEVVENSTIERPKLNLKPRSQPLEQPEKIVKTERKTLFGGARPRELVLKERGIDDVAINNLDTTQQPTRVKHELTKTETKPEVAVPSAKYGERAENFSLDQRVGRDSERKDHRLGNEKTEIQRGSWRNENWKNSKETEKQPEAPPEPETWRKPVDQGKPFPPDAPGLRYGKAATALELAQSFSRTISDAKAADRFSGQRGQPGQNQQIPFSRLTDTRDLYSGPTPRRQINGY